MPFTRRTVCASCSGTNSTFWRKGTNGQTFCADCAKKEIDGIDDTQTSETSSKTDLKDFSQLIGPTRKSSRIKPSRYKSHQQLKPFATKGRSRRVIFKKNPIKAPASVATVITSDHVFHNHSYWQVGDVASVMDDDGGIYYVQLRGFLQDQYCEKSAVLTWLLPTTASIPGKFDPATYIIGPEEDLPRVMDCFEFVMHAPSDYFYDRSKPYKTESVEPALGYISTHLGPEIRRVPPREQLYGLRDIDSDDTSTPTEKVKQKQDPEKRKRDFKDRKRGRKIAKKQASKSPVKLESGVQVKVEGIAEPVATDTSTTTDKRKIRERTKKRKLDQSS